MKSEATQFLDWLNETYCKLHTTFEELFWLFYMGDHSVEEAKNSAEEARDLFCASDENLVRTQTLIADQKTTPEELERLKIWERFFNLYNIPSELVPLREEIRELESLIAKGRTSRKEGYTDPKTGNFVEASENEMDMMVYTNPDEDIRKACFDAVEALTLLSLDNYVRVVGLRNRFAQALGFEDFYAYRLHISEGMTKDQVFRIFDKIFKTTRHAFDNIRELEKSMPGLRKPWNFNFMMSGSFTLEEDPFFPFKEALMRWGRSFAALGIDFKGGTLKLDLLDRKGKYNNGFCHYPKVVSYKDGLRIPGAAGFTCTLVYGQPGSGDQGLNTLFHEGGHAADRLNSEQVEVCLNTEWPPASIAWAETHSQFLDTMCDSIEWLTRYAKDKDGNPYPFDLFERIVRKINILSPLSLHSIMFVSEFEKLIYEERGLTAEKVLEIAKAMYRKYRDRDGDSLLALSVPHIYAWDSSGYYHAYGLSQLALMQWREYFYDNFGFIVDNPEVGREMTKVWRLGSLHNFADFVRIATGKDLSPEAFLATAMMDAETKIQRGRERIERLRSVKEFEGPVNLNARIQMVHGKEVIADNSVSFEDMAEKYAAWLDTQEKHE